MYDYVRWIELCFLLHIKIIFKNCIWFVAGDFTNIYETDVQVWSTLGVVNCTV